MISTCICSVVARPLSRGGWHLEGAADGTQITVSLPELNVNETASLGTDGRARFQFQASNLELWSPEHPRLYRVHIRAGRDELEDEMGFRNRRSPWHPDCSQWLTHFPSWYLHSC